MILNDFSFLFFSYRLETNVIVEDEEEEEGDASADMTQEYSNVFTRQELEDAQSDQKQTMEVGELNVETPAQNSTTPETRVKNSLKKDTSTLAIKVV